MMANCSHRPCSECVVLAFSFKTIPVQERNKNNILLPKYYDGDGHVHPPVDKTSTVTASG